MMSELKNWCMSKLQRMETRLTADARCGPLHRSSSLGGCTTLRGDSGGPSAGSAHCLVPMDPTEPEEGQGAGEGGATREEDMLANHYFVVQMDSSSGSLHTLFILLTLVDPLLPYDCIMKAVLHLNLTLFFFFSPNKM